MRDHKLSAPPRDRFWLRWAACPIATLISQGLFAADEHQGDMIYRKLGPTGERVSAIGLGGYHISAFHRRSRNRFRLIRSAIDRGINFLDNSWTTWTASAKC